MKAILAKQNDFELTELPQPTATGTDVLVEIQATSVNPVDTKIQSGLGQNDQTILGFDAVGIIRSVGDQVKNFKLGDQVFYAGSNMRAGSNAEYQLVDSRLVGKSPAGFSLEQIAAMPLTGITAWEALFEKMNLEPVANGNEGTILIINGAGGVGSIAIQLAKWAGLRVIATASRPETIQWSKKMGADLVINHRNDLADQLVNESIDHALILFSTDQYIPILASIIQPLGQIVSIVENQADLPIGGLLKDKSISFSWEFMFTKSKYQVDIASQGQILNNLAQLMEDGSIQSTMAEVMQGLAPQTFKKAYELVSSNKMVGKLVIKY